VITAPRRSNDAEALEQVRTAPAPDMMTSKLRDKDIPCG